MPVAATLPSADLLRQVLDYDPDTGNLHWKANDVVPAIPSRVPGKRALTCLTDRGYYRGGVLGQYCMAHRVIWKMLHGTDPKEIDHINGIKSDNRIANLRSVDRSANTRNMEKSKANKSGYTGVCHAGNKWRASIRDGGKQLHLGVFDTIEEAVAARKAKEREFGYHENHGRQKLIEECGAIDARMARIEDAVSEALDLLKGNDKWLAVKLRLVLQKGLDG